MGVGNKNTGVQFAKNGPFIPTRLLQALEDENVVIFCGAGVSMRLGLPNFPGLVCKICSHLGHIMSPDEKTSFNERLFDVTLGLIERRLANRYLLRSAVRKILEITSGSDLSTHEALLQLATAKDGCLRLVTTNFDQAFEEAFKKVQCTGRPVWEYAPYLPLPGKDWNSIVHLHGGLGNARDPNGESLVMTSADFGKAYITEAWASRFLTELFRRSSAVLFVGYSVADPAVRYIVDAFAADRDNSDSRVAIAYLLTDATDEEAAQKERTWKSRGIEPIVYNPIDNHRLLHETLQNCAKRYRQGYFDRVSVINLHSSKNPLGGLDQEAVSQITWALHDTTCYAAKMFAKHDPAPPLDWLETLEANGLFELPLPQQSYSPVTWMPTSQFVPLHPTSTALCQWLCTHLAEPKLAHWTIKKGTNLHPVFANQIRRRLENQETAPLPTGAFLFWSFVSSKGAPVSSSKVKYSVSIDREAIKKQRWTPLLRNQVLSWLAPTIDLEEPSYLLVPENIDLELVKSYVELELTPAAKEESWDIVEELLKRSDFDQIAKDLLREITSLLHVGMTYLQFLQAADEENDGTYADRLSIDDHSQNTRFHHWTAYVQLIKTMWERVANIDPDLSRLEVSHWMRIQFPIFRRFVLWSAGKDGGISAAESICYLRDQPSTALWGLDTHHELFQYLNRIASKLSTGEADQLTKMILEGPPRKQYRAELTQERFAEVKDRSIQLRLMSLQDSGLMLPVSAATELQEILNRHPEWSRSVDERDSFVVWTSERVKHHELENQSNEYQGWSDEQITTELCTNSDDPLYAARWRGLLIENVQRAIKILDQIAQADCFRDEIWMIALEYLSSEQTIDDCIRLFGTWGPQLGSEFISANLPALARVVERYCENKLVEDGEAFWQLWDLLIQPAQELTVESDDDAVFRALNSPIGDLANALLSQLGELNPKTYAEIPQFIKRRFELLLKDSAPSSRLARVLLVRPLAWLYKVNPDLVRNSILPRFDWSLSDEAKYVWSGFLSSGQLTLDLWDVLRPLFFKAFPHAPELGEYEDRLYAFFAFLLLHEEYSSEPIQARHLLVNSSARGRLRVAHYWQDQVNSATDYGATLFRERLKHLLTDVWPLESALKDEDTSRSFARLAINCGTEFANAVAAIIPFLTKIEKSNMLFHSLQETNHPEHHPLATLQLIDALIGDHIEYWAATDMKRILNRVASVQPDLSADSRWARLNKLLQKFE